MKTKGKFFAVGHGLTYALKVEDIHVLFDINKRCNIEELEKFYGNKIIDVLVISHFDEDHSDGIKKLYDNNFNIKRVYIPYIGNDEKLIIELYFYFNGMDYNNIMRLLREHNVEIIEVEGEISISVELWEINIHQSKGIHQWLLQI